MKRSSTTKNSGWSKGEKVEPFFTGADINELCEFIRDRMGIVVQDHQMTSLLGYLKELHQQKCYENFQDYLSTLKTVPVNSLQYEGLVSAVTIGESYFFRDEEQMSFLRDEWFPRLINEKQNLDSKIIRVWCAGCSYGQEVYSIAIMLKELIADPQNWSIDLMGTDINVRAISSAIEGKYRSWSFRGEMRDYVEKYFTRVDDTYCLSDEIKRAATFSYHNLLDNNYPSILSGTAGLDLIVCRNVLLYFGAMNSKKILERFANCLLPGGALLLGPTDLKTGVAPTLECKNEGSITYYENPSVKPFVETQVKKTVEVEQPEEFVVEIDFDLLLESVRALFEEENWVSIIEKPEMNLEGIADNAQLLLFKSIASANLGSLKEAMFLCEKSLELDELNPVNYLVQGLILQELNKVKEAEEKIRQSMFLDNGFIDAHYYLGLVLLRQGKIKEGLKKLNTTLHTLEKTDLKQSLYLSPNMKYSELLKSLKREISIYENKLREVL